MNPPYTHIFIHSVRSFSLPTSMRCFFLFRCLLSDCLTTGCLPTVWYVCLTDWLHNWLLINCPSFSFWSVWLSSYQFTDRLVDDGYLVFFWLVGFRMSISLHWPFAFPGGLLTDWYGGIIRVRHKFFKTYNGLVFKPSPHGCSSYRQISPMIKVDVQFCWTHQ